ncbi:MAG: putative motility protein [Oscillospiraceae bacterium]|nr:putative motility protein [Oscillospiraceae bacterium]
MAQAGISASTGMSGYEVGMRIGTSLIKNSLNQAEEQMSQLLEILPPPPPALDELGGRLDVRA